MRWTWYFEYKIFLGICCWSFGCLLNFYHSHFLIYSITSRLLYFCRFLLCMLLMLSRSTKCLVIFYCNGYTPLPKVIWTVVGSLLPSANCVRWDLLQMRRLQWERSRIESHRGHYIYRRWNMLYCYNMSFSSGQDWSMSVSRLLFLT